MQFLLGLTGEGTPVVRKEDGFDFCCKASANELNLLGDACL